LHFDQGLIQLGIWLQQGKLKYAETVLEGFDKLPEAFIGLFNGLNEGKMIVKV
jgi:NADPH-dependent curcumin reductase CurA